MDKQHFSLELTKSNKLTKLFQVMFGIVCAIVAIIWVILNLNKISSGLALWVTVLFLLGFAYYQVASGLGLAERFIEIDGDLIRLRRNSVLPVRTLNATELEKIEIYPVSLVFILKTGKPVILRFGTTFTDIIGPVKSAVEAFCTSHDLKIEYMENVF